jgi:hypothetical protein
MRWSTVAILPFLILTLAGCSFRAESLSKDMFHGTIKYAVIRSGDSPSADGNMPDK